MSRPLILTNCRTGPAAERFAVTIHDGRIANVAKIESRQPGDVIDLAGRRLRPSFVDAHLHLKPWALSLTALNLADAGSIQEARALIERAEAKLPPGAWLTGGGFDEALLGRPPRASDLSGIDRPVALLSRDGHCLWCNQIALSIASIDPGSDDPAFGRMGRDAAGRVEGRLYEDARLPLFAQIPEPGSEERNLAYNLAFEQLLDRGVSEIHDCSFRKADSPRGDLQSLLAGSALPLRVAVALAADELQEAIRNGDRSGAGGPFLRVGGLKQILDGTLSSATAAMDQPFDDRQDAGLLTLDPALLRQRTCLAASSGISSWIHCIGDRALRIALDAIEEAGSRGLSLPHRIEHAQMTPTSLLKRAVELGVAMSCQPSHLPGDLRYLANRLGSREASCYRYETMRRLGLSLAFGSDAPVEPPLPLLAVRAAVERRGHKNDRPFSPAESLTVEAAMAAHSIGGAAVGPWSREKGAIRTGLLADLMVLDPDPADELSTDSEVVLHLVAGKPVRCRL